MGNRLIEKQNMGLFVTNLINTEAEVVGAKREDGKYTFGKLTAANELCLDYDTTLLPPKMYLFPQKETLIRFGLGKEAKVEHVIEAKPIILFGVHPYDIKATELLDTAFSTTNLDINYLFRREKATIIGINNYLKNPTYLTLF